MTKTGTTPVWTPARLERLLATLDLLTERVGTLAEAEMRVAAAVEKALSLEEREKGVSAREAGLE